MQGTTKRIQAVRPVNAGRPWLFCLGAGHGAVTVWIENGSGAGRQRVSRFHSSGAAPEPRRGLSIVHKRNRHSRRRESSRSRAYRARCTTGTTGTTGASTTGTSGASGAGGAAAELARAAPSELLLAAVRALLADRGDAGAFFVQVGGHRRDCAWGPASQGRRCGP